MTTLPLDLLRRLHATPPIEAWRELFTFAWDTCRREITQKDVSGEVVRRDRAVAPADLFLATAGWDLWSSYYDSVPRTAERLTTWWNSNSSGRAVLILDALSLREAPWLIHGAAQRGYVVHSADPTGSELPADTNPFAEALGFGQRSTIENNGANKVHRLPGARTDSVDLPWRECADLIDASPDWVLWHHWPDERIHDLSSPGRGLASLAKEAAVQLTDNDFWGLIERLSTGRRLIITGDHGYAATGQFPDAADQEQAQHLRTRFKSRRSASGELDSTGWVPPIDIVLDTPSGRHAFVLGRRKWRNQGGYPTLAHGGLSLLETAVPFVELSRPLGD